MTNDITLVAKWGPITYTISYDLQGGAATNKTEYNAETETFTLENPTKTGYTFIGWSGTDIDEMSMEATIEKGSFGDRSYTANWQINKYTITLDANGGNAEFDTIDVEYFGSIELPTPTRDNYAFMGWHLDGSEFTETEYTLTNDITLVAKWETYVLGDIEYTYKTAISVNDEISIDFFDVKCTDNEGNPADITISVNGEQTEGNTITVKIVAKGKFNKAKQVTMSDIKVYDTPELIYTYVDYINLNDITLTASYFSATAIDSFGESLDVTAYYDGNYQAGEYATVILKATDASGNAITATLENIALYDTPTLSYNASGVECIKLSSKGEEFGTTALDSFGNACTIKILKLDGTAIKKGITASLIIVATDSHGNQVQSEVIENIKIYGMPTIVIDDALYETTNVDFMAIVYDSFGEELYTEITLDGELTDGNTVYVTVKATDNAGNQFEETYKYIVNHEHVYESSKICSQCGYVSKVPSDGLEYTLSTDGTYYIVTGIGTCTDTNIVIPYIYNNLPVTSIGEDAFKGCTSLKSVTIGDSVTTIGDYAFYNCTSLENVNYFGTIENWCNISFNNYSANPLYNGAKLYLNGQLVTELVIPDTVTEIKDYAFRGCTSLKSVTIGDSVTSIGEDAFYNCTSLENVNYFGTIENWCNISFNNYSANPLYNGAKLYLNGQLVTELVIPDTVTEIKDHAFRGCDSLTSVTIPDSVTYIGEYAFKGCTSLKSVTIGDSVTSIGEDAFYNCTSLASITIGDSVTTIGDYAFCNCTSLASITIGDSVTTIGDYAFYNCTSLASITIPDSVTYIGDYAFRGCTSLTSVTIPDSVTYIGKYAFKGCTSLKSVTIPNSVKYIGECAFWGCDSLTIYCEATCRPSGWDEGWRRLESDGVYAYYVCPVVWGYGGE